MTGGKQQHHGPSVDDLVEYYALRGISAEIVRFVGKYQATQLLETSKSIGAILLIVGAYSHSHETQVLFGGNLGRRSQGGADVGAHRSSMLQDLDQGRPMEIDALVGSVKELGRVTDTPTPTIDTVLSLVALRGRIAGLYGT